MKVQSAHLAIAFSHLAALNIDEQKTLTKAIIEKDGLADQIQGIARSLNGILEVQKVRT